MILHRLTEAIRNQNWFTLVIEFVILVAGIFVGLQVDGWNQARNDRALGQKYLLRLTEDIQADIDNFHRLEQIFETKAMTIIDLRDLPVSKLLARPPAVLMRDLGYSTWVALPALQSATFSELASSGRLALIQDVPLRGELSSYYAGYQLMSDILAEPVGEYRRLFFETMPGEIWFEWRLSDHLGDLDRLGEALDGLQSHPRFGPAANAEISYSTSLVFWLRLFREQAQEMLKLLQESTSDDIEGG